MSLSARLGSLAARSGAVVRYDNAYILHPGTVHIQGLHIADPAGRWLVSARHTEIELAPASLLSGPLRVTRVASDVRALESGRFRLVESPGSIVAESAGPTWTVNAHAPRARLHAAGAALTGEVTARLQLHVPDLGARVAELHGGTLEARDIVTDPPGPGPARLAMEADLTDLTGTLRPGERFRLSAHARVRGPDASPLFDLAGLPPGSSARWAVSVPEGQLFTIDAHVVHTRHRLVLEDAVLRSGPLLVRGYLHERPGERRGAFLVHRGSLVLGLELTGDRADIVLGADEDWLASRRPSPTSL